MQKEESGLERGVRVESGVLAGVVAVVMGRVWAESLSGEMGD